MSTPFHNFLLQTQEGMQWSQGLQKATPAKSVVFQHLHTADAQNYQLEWTGPVIVAPTV